MNGRRCYNITAIASDVYSWDDSDTISDRLISYEIIMITASPCLTQPRW